MALVEIDIRQRPGQWDVDPGPYIDPQGQTEDQVQVQVMTSQRDHPWALDAASGAQADTRGDGHRDAEEADADAGLAAAGDGAGQPRLAPQPATTHQRGLETQGQVEVSAGNQHHRDRADEEAVAVAEHLLGVRPVLRGRLIQVADVDRREGERTDLDLGPGVTIGQPTVVECQTRAAHTPHHPKALAEQGGPQAVTSLRAHPDPAAAILVLAVQARPAERVEAEAAATMVAGARPALVGIDEQGEVECRVLGLPTPMCIVIAAYGGRADAEDVAPGPQRNAGNEVEAPVAIRQLGDV